jgi:hypothetical protein
MKRWLRWLLLIPCAWAAWHVALATGIAVHSTLEALCAPEQMISGMCTAPWFQYAERVVFCASAGLAAALILITSTLIAPSHRARVAAITLAAGSLVALVMGILAMAYAELITAIVVGALTTTWLLKCRWVQASSNGMLKQTRAIE